ncbi:MAG: adenylate/guanylate cyclase domain-containing protein [Hyphomicrobiaceae bacterium]
MPERVRHLVARQERESERLIGWVQLGIVVTFAALYLIAPRPADAGMSYQPVPLALAAYALFTIGRLALSYRQRLPGGFVILSIVADIALLLGLIWTFHLEYGQTAAFSLKVPTFIYIFVFVALRALRFDPRYVLAAGLFSAIGWGVLVVLTIGSSGSGAITRNFVTYLTSNTILIGAEFDKIVTILLVSLILTAAVYRARRTLLTAIREEAAGREVKRFLSAGVAEAIAGAEELVTAGTAVERQAAIVMLDIRGFTRLSTTMPPAQVVTLLTSFHERVVPIVRANGGVIDKFLGDGIMVTFGAVTVTETAAADALRTLDLVMDAAELWASEVADANGLHVNAACASGSVVFATLGNDERLEYTVIGEAVNLAAKLEKHNKVVGSRALADRSTLERAFTQGYQPRRKPRLLMQAEVAGVTGRLDLAALA